MKVTPLPATETLGGNASAPSASAAGFGQLIDAVSAPADGKAVDAIVPNAKEGPAELKLSLVAAPVLETMAVAVAPAVEPPVAATLQAKADEKEAPKGSGEDVDHQKLWVSADDLVDFAEVSEGSEKTAAPVLALPDAPLAKSAAIAQPNSDYGDLVAANGLVPVEAPVDEGEATEGVASAGAPVSGEMKLITPAPLKLLGETLADAAVYPQVNDRLAPLPDEGADFVVAAPLLPSSVPVADRKASENGSVELADPEWAHDNAPDAPARAPVVAASPELVATAPAAGVTLPTAALAVAVAPAQPAAPTAALAVAPSPADVTLVVAPVKSAGLAEPIKQAASATGHRQIDVSHASGAATHAVKVLHALEVIEDADEVISVEGEVVDAAPAALEGEPIVENAREKPKADVRVASERAPSPSNLGRPAFAMMTQEVLQGSVTDRHDGVPVSFPIGVGAVAQPPSPLGAGHVAAAPHIPHLVVATTAERMVPDIGFEVAREIANGKSELSIRLDPADLGRVEIKMTFSEDGRMRAVIAADNQSTFDLLRRDADVLARTLADAGVKTSAGDLRFDMRQGSPDQRQAQAESRFASTGGKDNEVVAEETAKPARSTRGRLV